MKVRRITKSGDWTFGQGLANYTTGDEAIAQNVKTRLLSFQNDFFLDTSANIDWLRLLGAKENRKAILSEVERVCRETIGVLAVNSIKITELKKRDIKLMVELTTINGTNLTQEVAVNE